MSTSNPKTAWEWHGRSHRRVRPLFSSSLSLSTSDVSHCSPTLTTQLDERRRPLFNTRSLVGSDSETELGSSNLLKSISVQHGLHILCRASRRPHRLHSTSLLLTLTLGFRTVTTDSYSGALDICIQVLPAFLFRYDLPASSSRPCRIRKPIKS